jgi:hypothetical protein
MVRAVHPGVILLPTLTLITPSWPRAELSELISIALTLSLQINLLVLCPQSLPFLTLTYPMMINIQPNYPIGKEVAEVGTIDPIYSRHVQPSQLPLSL